MIVGGEKVTETAAMLLAKLDADGELVEVDEVLVLVAVHYGAAEGEDEAEAGSLFYRCTSARYHVQAGLLAQGVRAVDQNQRSEEES